MSTMEKAGTHKYIRRIPKPGGGYRYIYRQAATRKPKTEEYEKWGWIDRVPGLPDQTLDKYGKPNPSPPPEYLITDPERKALHDRIVEDKVSRVKSAGPDERPNAIVMMGGPGSGKSSLIKQVDKTKYVSMDADAVKEELPEYITATQHKARNAAFMAHGESSIVAKRIRDRAVRERKSLIVDGTGKNAKTYGALIDKLKESGYHVTLIMPHITGDEGQERAELRSEKTGRHVPEDILRGAYGKIAPNFEALAAKCDEARLFDNAGPQSQPAKLVLEYRSGESTVHDENFMADFRAKSASGGFKTEPNPKKKGKQRTVRGPGGTRRTVKAFADLVDGILKAGGHKYISRKPDGKGGWLYDYGSGPGKPKGKDKPWSRYASPTDIQTAYTALKLAPYAGPFNIEQSRDGITGKKQFVLTDRYDSILTTGGMFMDSRAMDAHGHKRIMFATKKEAQRFRFRAHSAAATQLTTEVDIDIARAIVAGYASTESLEDIHSRGEPEPIRFARDRYDREESEARRNPKPPMSPEEHAAYMSLYDAPQKSNGAFTDLLKAVDHRKIMFRANGDDMKLQRNPVGRADLMKAGGEGSRGGKIIGRTKAGKPIYAKKDGGGDGGGGESHGHKVIKRIKDSGRHKHGGDKHIAHLEKVAGLASDKSVEAHKKGDKKKSDFHEQASNAIILHAQNLRRKKSMRSKSGQVIDLVKAGGPFIGPRGGKWADAKHTIQWKEGKTKSKQRKHAHAGSLKGWLNDHKNTTADEHQALQTKHLGLANVAVRKKHASRRGSNEWHVRDTENKYHSEMSVAHATAKAALMYGTRSSLEPYDEMRIADNLREAREHKHSLDEDLDELERQKPPTERSIGSTRSGKKIQFMSRENYRDETWGWSSKDHADASSEHRLQQAHHESRSDTLQENQEWQASVKEEKAAKYHRYMKEAHGVSEERKGPPEEAIGRLARWIQQNPADLKPAGGKRMRLESDVKRAQGMTNTTKAGREEAEHAMSVSPGALRLDLEPGGFRPEPAIRERWLDPRNKPEAAEKASLPGGPFVDLIKSKGEGSRGGRILGHTDSGKPIYAAHAGNYKKKTKGWTADDHEDAVTEHRAHQRHHLKEADKAYKRDDNRAAYEHNAAAMYHSNMKNTHNMNIDQSGGKVSGSEPERNAWHAASIATDSESAHKVDAARNKEIHASSSEKSSLFVDLIKAAGHKYKRRIPKPGGGYTYVYEDPYAKKPSPSEEKYTPPPQPEGITSPSYGSYNVVDKQGKTLASGDFDRGSDGYYFSAPGQKGQKFFDTKQDAVAHYRAGRPSEKK
jgi:predicted ABC-type ATPase